MKKGLFISIEGGEACGKTTQVRMLKKYFSDNFNDDQFMFLREPGGTPLAEEIRKLLLHYNGEAPLPMTELLLYCAARCQIANTKIKPALNKGNIVIADRFYDSTIAYQGEARKVMSKSDILKLTKLVIGDLRPDLTFYLKLSPAEAFKRKEGLEPLDRIESEGLEFHNAVAKGYDYIAQKESDRFCIIDASLSPEEISKIIINKIEEKMKEFNINKENSIDKEL